jgi:hypothetical protein
VIDEWTSAVDIVFHVLLMSVCDLCNEKSDVLLDEFEGVSRPSWSST